MSKISEVIAESYRGGRQVKPNVTNKLSVARKKMYEKIKNATGEDPDTELDYSLQLIKENTPQIQRYVMSQNELPADNSKGLAVQAYKLRCNQISAVAQALGVADNEAQVFLEQDEAESMDLESSDSDNYLGQLFAPIGIAATRIEQRKYKARGRGDNYTEVADSYDTQPENLSGDLVSGITQTIGNKVNTSTLIRAAQNKPAGLLGFLSTGGTAHYNALRDYFQKNPTIAKQVISGAIRDESQLPGWGINQLGTTPTDSTNILDRLAGTGSNIGAPDILDAIRKSETKRQINKMLPFIIAGVVILIVATILITKSASKR